MDVSSDRFRRVVLVIVVALGALWLGLTLASAFGDVAGVKSAVDAVLGLALLVAGAGGILVYGTGDHLRSLAGALFVLGGSVTVLLAIDGVALPVPTDAVSVLANLAIALGLLVVLYVQSDVVGESVSN